MDRTREVCSEETTAVRWKVTIPLTHLLITFYKITPPVNAGCCEIPAEICFLSCFRPVRGSVLVLPILYEAAPDRPAPTPATGIWYVPHGRVGEPCGRGAQIPSNGEARKGKRARNMSRNRPCEGLHLEGIKNLPQL